jgi:AcrR family transcriptional regulator
MQAISPASPEPAMGRTFTENARRALIVRAAIEVIADVGYRKTSFARIALHAGLSSTGLIPYYFGTKTKLVTEVVDEIYRELASSMVEQMRDASTATGALHAYIEGNVELAKRHPIEMKALLDIFLAGGLEYDGSSEQQARSPIEAILKWGQETGEFRDFDCETMATVIRRSVEGPSFLMDGDPEFDHAAYARELVTTFDLATRVKVGST